MKPLRPPPASLLDKYYGTAPHELYSTSVTVTGGTAAHARASGIARSDDGNLDVNLRLPPQLGGAGGGTNPEQLFAASYAACLHGALSMIAAKSGVAIPDASVVASVTFGRDPVDGLFLLSADVRIHLPGVDPDVARALVRNTERFSPYAKMAREGIANVITLALPDDSR
jgi:lipoyl-dependent peroxiredoxin